MKRRIDLNADIGESYGIYRLGMDDEILQYVTSANIACGFHAGDPATMRKTVRLALERGVAIGAHPGLPDRLGFGRRRLDISPQDAYDLTVYQIGALAAFARAEGGRLQHVKPHGALYNMAAADIWLAEAIAKAVHDVDPDLILFGLAGSCLIAAGRRAGLRVASEVFADRTYQRDGSLTPRTEPNALITDVAQALGQVIRMVEDGVVRTVTGEEIPIEADTVCLHGDGPHAVEFARQLRSGLVDRGFHVQAVGR